MCIYPFLCMCELFVLGYVYAFDEKSGFVTIQYVFVLVVKDTSLGEANGMLGSILRGSHAYESLDVVLLQQNGNMHKKRKVFGNEEKKTDKR